MSKRADINWVLVSMVLAVIVLAISTYLFWKYSTESARGASGIASCQARNGECRATTACGSDEINIGRYTCKENEICCVKIKTSGPA